MKPAWLQQFDEHRIGRTRGYIVSGNTSDKVFYPESEIPPIPLKYFLASYLARDGYAVASYSLANSFEELRPQGAQPNTPKPRSPFSTLPNNLAPDQVLAHFTTWLRTQDPRVALILDYADHLAPASGGMSAVVGQMHLAMLEILHAWGLDENIRATRNLVLLVSHENQMNELLLQGGAGYKRLDISLPNELARREFLDRLRAKHTAGRDLFANTPADEVARLTSGLPLVEIEELFASAGTEATAPTVERVRERKTAVIKQMCGGLLEVHEPAVGFEGVSGLWHAKDELNRVVSTFKKDPRSAPQAICFVGVPGCGKSYLVHALAKELGYPCLAMRNVREGLVGATERNLERVLWVAENLSPCVIWIDEIDQQFGQRNTGQSMDGGVSERFMARIWEFMGSVKHRGRILWVGTSNRPDTLDAALLDRFQLVIPFLHPTPAEVDGLMPELARQVGRTLAGDVRGIDIASLSSVRQPTVRALQEIVARAGALEDADAVAGSGNPIDHAHLMEAALDFKPNYNPLQHELIALNALRMASFSSLLPWRARRGMRSNAHIPEYVHGLVNLETGALDIDALYQRIEALTATLQVEQQRRRF